MLKGLLAATVVAFLMVGSSGAGPLEDGYAAFQGLDFATAVRWWRPLAEQGHAKAQFSLGLMYSEGRGVPQDDSEAVKWHRRAAQRGVP